MNHTTNPQAAEPLRIPIGRNITYAVRGMPPVANAYGPGFLVPTEVSLTYRANEDSQLGRFHAYVKGQWLRDGELVPSGQKLPGQHYSGDPSGWPEWLAEELRLHDPDTPSVVVSADRATLLREAADGERPLSPDYEHPECGFHWHGRDDMDIPMRDGQPVCPRCELAKVEKKLAYTQRTRDEVGEECKRRGRIKLEQAERIIRLERELDGVRDQLGKEMLRADDAEAELRRLAAEQPDRGAEERDRYRTAWRSARERAQAYREGVLLHVAQRDFWQMAAEQNYKLYAGVAQEADTDGSRLAAEQPTETQDGTTADKAAVLLEIATTLDGLAETDMIRKRRSLGTARRLLAGELRKMAAEPTAALPAVVEQPDTQTREA